MAAENIFGIPQLWEAINDLDFKVENNVLNKLQIGIQSLLERATLWLIRNTRETLSIQRLTDTYKPGVEIIRNNLATTLTEETQEYMASISQDLQSEGLPKETAETLCALPYVFYGLDIIRVSSTTDKEVLDTAQTYFVLERDLGLYWLRQSVTALPAEGMW